MAKQRGDRTFQPPLGGTSARQSFQSQPPYTSYRSSNFWPIDVRTGRQVSATRPAMEVVTIPGASIVTMLSRVNGSASGKPYQSMIASFGGNVYYWGGTSWTAATGAQAGDIETTRAVYASPFLEEAYILIDSSKPLVFDYDAATVTTLTESAGTAPSDARIAATWQGALWLSSVLATPNIIYASRTGDATDWDFGVSLDDEGGAFATTGENAGLLNGPVTALMPQTSDTMIVSTVEGLVAMRGHPRRGGIFDPINETTYVMGQGAWCKAPGDVLFFLTPLGLMSLSPEPTAIPTQISREQLPDELVGLIYTYENPVVAMAYDSRWNGIHITVRGVQEQAWWYDLNTGGFNRMELTGYPYVMMEFPPFVTQTASGVLYAGAAYSGLSRFDAFGTEAFSGTVTTGPIKLTDTSQSQGIIKSFRVVFARDSPESTVEGQLLIAGGNDAQDAVSRLENGEAQYSIDLVTLKNNNGLCHPLVTGSAFVFSIESNSGNVAWEEAAATLEDSGPNRFTRTVQVTSAGTPSSTEETNTEFDDGLWTGYQRCTPSTPGATLVDHTHFHDLSGMDSGWWAAVGSTGADIRVTDDNNFEIPYDLIRFDYANNEGLIAFKYTQTIPARPVRIWAGSLVETPYAETDTYGGWNAYDDNWRAFYPSGGGADRTQYENDLTMTGATAGDSTGPIGGLATDYQNQTNWYGTSSNDFPSTTPVTIITAAQRDGSNNFVEDSVGLWLNLNNAILLTPRTNSTLASTRAIARLSGSDETATSDDGTAADATWHHHTAVLASATSRTAYIDGGGANTDTDSLDATGMTHFVVGKNGPAGLSAASFDGLLAMTSVHDVARDANWVAYQAAMMDQGSFWTCEAFEEINDPDEIISTPDPDEGACPSGIVPVTETGTWSGYCDATPQTDPTIGLIWQTHWVDLSLMHSSWWSAVATDGADIRVTDTDNIFLPFDLIEFDATAMTGFLVFRRTALTTSQAVRIWVGNGSASAVPACASYGQYAAYEPRCVGFWPSGAGNDRTQFLHHLTGVAGGSEPLVEGGASGPVGNTATTYDGATQYSLATSTFNLSTSIATESQTGLLAGDSNLYDATIFAAVKLSGSFDADYGIGNTTVDQFNSQVSFGLYQPSDEIGLGGMHIAHTAGKIPSELRVGRPGHRVIAYTDSVTPLSQWRLYHGYTSSLWTTASNETKRLFVDGANFDQSSGGAAGPGVMKKICVGANFESGAATDYCKADIALVCAFSHAVTSPYAAFFAAMMDQSTFWSGTWSWTASSSSLPQ